MMSILYEDIRDIEHPPLTARWDPGLEALGSRDIITLEALCLDFHHQR